MRHLPGGQLGGIKLIPQEGWGYMWEGVLKLISGGHRIMPVECRAGIWYLGPTIERSYVAFNQNKYPLRTLPAKGEDPADFDKYVDQCSLKAELPDIYM